MRPTDEPASQRGGRRRVLAAAAVSIAAVALSACTSSHPDKSKSNAAGDASSLSAAAACIKSNSELVGPHGEPGTMATKVTVTPADIEAARKAVAGGAIAISEHFSSDYTTQVVSGIKAAASSLGARVITTDAGGTPQKQVSDIESLLAQRPKLLVVLPVDAAASAPGLAAAANAHVPVVVVGSALNTSNYSALVSAYDYGGGLAAGAQVIEALKGVGKIAIMPYKYSLWHVDNRVKGFRAAIACDPGIKVVEDTVTCQAKADCTSAFTNVLTAHPDIKAAFGAYDGIAQGMNAAAVSQSWKGFITTSDLGLETAQLIASGNQPLQGTAAQLTDCQGKATGNAVVLTLAGKTPPKTIFCDDVPVEKGNVAQVYQQLFGKSLA
jgi:ribose transport system substrate-binding protein